MTQSLIAAVAAAVVAAAIYAGSRGLRYFDAALVGYATAVVVLTFGVTYRYVVWVSSPPARRYLRRGWQAFFSWRNFRRLPTAVPRSVLGYLGFQTFLRARGRGRWLAHQLVFWGVVLATLITFPLTFGWLAFLSDSATGPAYTIYVLGFRTVTFDALSLLGWLVFHGLDIAAVMVLAGCGWFLWRRFRHREATTGQRFGYDFFPLVGLVASSAYVMISISSEVRKIVYLGTRSPSNEGLAMLTAYVIVGGLLVAYLSFSVGADVARYHRVLTAMANANVPESWLTTLATLKAAGALGLLVGIGVPLIGTTTAGISTTAAAIGNTAAVGVILFFVGAVITHLRARDYSLAPATVFLLLAMTTLVLGLTS